MKLTPFFLFFLAFCLSVPSVSLAHSEGDDNAHEGKMEFHFDSRSDADGDTAFVSAKCWGRETTGTGDYSIATNSGFLSGNSFDCVNSNDETGFGMLVQMKNMVGRTLREMRYYRGHCTDDWDLESCLFLGDTTFREGDPESGSTRYYLHCESDEKLSVTLSATDGDDEPSGYECATVPAGV